MTTFKVDDVDLNTTPRDEANFKRLLDDKFGVRPESCFKLESGRKPINSGEINTFVGAVLTAYANHYPLVITPDTIWMCIAQGLSKHVNTNSEKLRKHFVKHEGKKPIIIQRNDFVKGAENPWPEAFEQFSDAIRAEIGDETHSLITPEFSTTGPTEKAACQVVLMDTLKSYFEYRFITSCGIPEITLEGTVEDWVKLRDKAVSLSKYDLEWWITPLTSVLDQFVNAASGKIDKSFWSSICKQRWIGSGGGSSEVTGWIINLFPYINEHPNTSLYEWSGKKELKFVDPKHFPKGIVSTPFTWEYYGKEYPMYFGAGFVCASQDLTTLAIRAEIGWVVLDQPVVFVESELRKLIRGTFQRDL